MDFTWSDEQLRYKSEVVAFARSALNDGLIERDHEGEFSLENWKKCANYPCRRPTITIPTSTSSLPCWMMPTRSPGTRCSALNPPAK